MHFLYYFFYTFHALSLSLTRLFHWVVEDAAGTGLVSGALGENCGVFGFSDEMRVRTAKVATDQCVATPFVIQASPPSDFVATLAARRSPL